MKRMSCFIFAGLFVFVLGCGRSYKAERMYWNISKKYGRTLVNTRSAGEKDFSEAITALKDVVNKFPEWSKSGETQFHIAEMYASRNNLNAASGEFTKVIMNFSQNTELCAKAQFAKGFIYESQNNFNKAVEEYNLVIERFGNTMTGLQAPIYLAQYYLRNKMKEESDKTYQKAIRAYVNMVEINPYGKGVPVLQNLIISAYSLQGKDQEAVDTLNSMVAHNPNSESSPMALYRIAMLYKDRLKKPDLALAAFKRIIQFYPNIKLTKDAQLQLGNLSAIQGDMGGAQSAFETILEKYPEDSSLCAMAQFSIAATREKEGNWDEALKEYNKLLKGYPGTVQSFEAPLIIAGHYQRLKQDQQANIVLDEAIKSYKEAIKNSPQKQQGVLAYEFIASAYGAQNNWKEAVSWLEKQRIKYPQTPRSPLSLYRIGAIYLEKLNNNSKSREAFAKFVREYPDHPLAVEARKKLEIAAK